MFFGLQLNGKSQSLIIFNFNKVRFSLLASDTQPPIKLLVKAPPLTKRCTFWLDFEICAAPPSTKRRSKTQAKAIAVSMVLIIFDMTCKACKAKKWVRKCLL